MFSNLVLPLAAVLLLGSGLAVSEARAEGKGARPEIKALADVDADKDGAISAEESAAMASKKFDEIDKNKDGSVGVDELEKYREAEKAQRMEERKKREAEMKKMYREKVDPDGDGKITREEFMKSAAERQKAEDLNGDGKITKEEIVERYKNRSEARKEKVNARKGEGRAAPKEAPQGE